MEDLRIGNSILADYIDLETEKQERAARSKKNEKASIEAAAEKVNICYPLLLRVYVHVDTIVLQVKLAFMDDRRSKLLRDEMEKERRAARDLAAANQAATTSSIQELSPPHSIAPESE